MDSNEQTPLSRVASFVMTVPMAVLISGVMISGSILYAGNGQLASGLPSLDGAAQDNQIAEDEPVKIADPSTLFSNDDPMLGNVNAKVTIVEFSDFQCPFCRRFWTETYGQLKKDYIDTGKVRLIYRDFPLLQIHAAAKPSALAAACAQEQGKFWEFHDKINEEQAKKGTGTVEYGIVELKQWAAQIGVKTAQFNQCLDSKKYEARVDKDTADASTFGVSGTPSFFVNGEMLVGAQPYSTFKALIDSKL